MRALFAAINLSSTSPAGEEEEVVGGRSGVGWGGKSGTAKCRAAFRNLCCERLLRDYRDDIIAGVVAISRESRRNNRRVVCILCIFSAYILWVLDQVNTESHTAWCIYFLIGKFVYIYIYICNGRANTYLLVDAIARRSEGAQQKTDTRNVFAATTQQPIGCTLEEAKYVRTRALAFNLAD